MAGEISGSGMHDALVILGAAGIVIPAFARFRISPVIGFLLVGLIVGPSGLGGLARDHPWLSPLTISSRESLEPFANLGIILLLFGIGLELSFRRLYGMRRMVFGIGAAQMLGAAAVIFAVLQMIGDWPVKSALALSLALAMSSTALCLKIAGTRTPVGRAALSMLLFEDLALVPLLFFFGTVDAQGVGDLVRVVALGTLVILAMLIAGRFLLPPLFAQAARTKSPELFLAVSLVVVILAAAATSAVGLGPIIGALVAGLLIAETEYHSEVEVVTAPLRGLALGVFLITVGMLIDVAALAGDWPLLLAALAGVMAVKVVVTGLLLKYGGAGSGVAAETSVLMASPSETTLIVIAAAGAAGVLTGETVAFWSAATALGLMLTPLLAALGKRLARRVETGQLAEAEIEDVAGRTVIFGFGRVGRMVADMLAEHGRPYLAVDHDIDGIGAARDAGHAVMFGDVARREMVDKLALDHAAAAVLTMDDPVLTQRLARRLRRQFPDLPIIARARDAAHAAKLYRAGVTDAVPEAMEASLQLSEAVLVDIGVAMGPVIASIHEKRSELRAEIMEEGELEHEPSLGRRRVRDMAGNRDV
ncbi:cation:proton antiporter [Sphingomonas mesophila]|uniref:cation:proton antiporter domain-containing protein n=1 Tax=Sphingomonas mesophila TaxID=2303576 RepID=UPI000E57F5FB|nr:cation:proton antiporter [Sphingomonas mesophila]